MKAPERYVVILAGGSGTRFWPASRKRRPKQFQSIIGPGSMFCQTVGRVLPLDPRGLIVVTNAAQVDDARAQLESMNIPVTADPGRVVPGGALLVAEPRSRNTAPAIALAAALVSRLNPEGVMMVLPSDHFIPDEEAFRQTLLSAEEVALLGRLVTLGITPHRPETGYGYIRKSVQPVGRAFAVEQFREKPDLDTALAYLESGEYFWNAGMFIWRADVIWQELKAYMPELAAAMEPLRDASRKETLESDMARAYDEVTAESIDYGVMEKSGRVAVVPSNFIWSDVGSWSSLWELEEKDTDGNAGGRKLVALESTGNLVRSEKTTALVGVKDMIIVETSDALLVCRRDRAQRVKEVLATLKKLGEDHLL
jgi:mannose-1-phosphate guanylyltransferase